jgi:protein involved in polysaccharide export with SLBB domain
LKGASEKLRFLGLQTQSASGFAKLPQYAIFRSANGVTSQLAADPSSVLAPGDVVEVSLPSDTPTLATLPSALATGNQTRVGGGR